MNDLEYLQRQINEVRDMAARAYMHESSLPVFLTAPLTSTSWDGDARSTTAKTKIDLSAVFGAPANISAVLFGVACRDGGSAAGDTWLLLSPNDTVNEGLSISPYPVNDRLARGMMVVPCNADGDVFFQISAIGVDTMDAWLQIFGYWL